MGRSLRYLAYLVLAPALLVIAVACGDDDTGGPMGGTPMPVPETAAAAEGAQEQENLDDLYYPEPESTPATTSSPAAPAAAAGEVVESPIEGFALLSHTVSVGDTIRWENLDSSPHTASADDGTFHSGNLGQGASFEFQFDAPGTYDYFCQIHPSMRATITVE